MPCYRCGTRQVDPDRGSSPWLRGVRADRQVLICPGCQLDGAWVTDLDRCALCASVHLVRRLGEVECRDCGAVGAEAVGSGSGGSGSVGPPGSGGSGSVDGEVGVGEISVGGTGGAGVADFADAAPAGLAEEVEQALARVLRSPSVRAAGAAGTG